MTCNHCIGGYVRKFKSRTKTEKALFYDELCPDCEGDFYTSESDYKPETLSETYPAETTITKECPF